MALTVSVNNNTVFGNKRVIVADVDFDASYPTGGETLAPSTLGLRKVELLLVGGKGGLQFEYDYTNKKLQAFEQGVRTSGTAAADSTTGVFIEDIAGANTTFRAMGTAIDTNISLGKLREVGDTVDLSGVTDVRILAVGF